MTIQATATTSTAVLSVAGTIGAAELATLHGRIVDFLRARRREVVLDFSGVDHIRYQDAPGLALEFELARSYDADLRLAGVTPYVSDILAFAGLHGLLETQRTAPGVAGYEGAAPAPS